jgi:hypothetical protein
MTHGTPSGGATRLTDGSEKQVKVKSGKANKAEAPPTPACLVASGTVLVGLALLTRFVAFY